MRAIQQFLFSKFKDEYDRLFLWTPVFLAFGIAIYFGLNNEPKHWYGLPILIFTATSYYAFRNHFLIRITLLAGLIAALGYTAAQYRTLSTSTPMLNKKVKDISLTGHVVGVDLRPRDKRLLLDTLQFQNWPTGITQPQQVRLTLRHKGSEVNAGDTVKLTATLLPATGPVIEGAYDMAFNAYFEKIGALGYITQPPMVIEKAKSNETLRQQLTHNLRDQMDPITGAIATALITGDRTGIPKKLRQNFADAGIAHILAISGLHLSILAGLIFLIIRRGLCLIPQVALNVSTKKWAAFISILITFGYLLLSGVATPALRAFVMTSLVMLAVIVDRAALTLRNVAIAAFFILLIWPEMLFHPSFQLSFAAVTALIAAYEKYRQQSPTWSKHKYKLPRVFYYIFGIMSTTLIASLATAPFAAYTFNRFAVHSIEANLVAIPLTSFWIMPAALISVLAMPLGLEGYPLEILSQGINYLNEIATTVSNWPSSVLMIPQISPWTLALFTLGLLWIVIWRTRWRWFGVFGPAGLAMTMLLQSTPDIFVSQRYGLIGIKDDQTLWMNTTDRGWYIFENWQQVAGLYAVKKLEEHPAFICDGDVCIGKIEGASYIVDQHWRVPVKNCAEVMLSFSNTHKKCYPKIKLPETEFINEVTRSFIKSEDTLHQLKSSKFPNRSWSPST